MKNAQDDGREPVDLDQLIARITVDAQEDDEQLCAFHHATFKDGVKLPCNAFVTADHD